MENTAFTGDDESEKHPHGVEETENGKAPKEVENNIDGYMKPPKPAALAPYAGMNKEDLLRFADTPFWNRVRLVCLILFWLAWLGLIAAIVTLTIVLPRCTAPPSQSWWQKSTFYQVYVRSFQDSDGDGSGDLKGLRGRLDYMESLNVDAVVMSSVLDGNHGNSSGSADVGYQVVNYNNIDALFGDLQDMDDLITEAHDRGLRVVMDFVPNFSGLDHPWFQASAAATSPSDRYWNYYVWQPCGVNGADPPNNWLSVYSNESAWRYNTTRGECYLAQFLETQPDLNLDSAYVQEELEAILRFWLVRGVDGFRVNSVAYLYENQDLTNETFLDDTCDSNNPTDMMNYDCYLHNNTRDRPEVHDVVARWKAIILEYSTSGQERVLITDADADLEETVTYFSQLGSIGADLPLYYDLRNFESLNGRQIVQDIIQPWINGASGKGTTDWLVDYQDASRIEESTTGNITIPLAVLSLTLPGSSFLYYGQELGMRNWVDGGNDPVGRDMYRAPMQWNGEDDAGFTNGTTQPYIPVNDDYPTRNVEVMEEQSDSLLNIFRNLIALKRDATAFQYGNTHFNTGGTPEEVAAFVREYDGTDRYLVIVNLSDDPVTGNYDLTYGSDFEVPGDAVIAFRTSTASGGVGSDVRTGSVHLEPFQAVILTWEYTR